MSEQKLILEYGKPPKKRRPYTEAAIRVGLVCLAVTIFFAAAGLGDSAQRGLLTGAVLVGTLTGVIFVVAFILFLFE